MYPTTNLNWAVDEDTDYSDVLAVRWLSPCLLVGGCRSGLVDLHDRRVPKKIKLLKHSSAVTSIRGIDEHRVLVAGMNHQVTLTTIKPSSYKLQTNPYFSYMLMIFDSALSKVRSPPASTVSPNPDSLTRLPHHPTYPIQLTVIRLTETSGSKSRVL